MVSLCQVGAHPMEESIGDPNMQSSVISPVSRGVRRKSGGGARNEQRRNPGRLVCTPAGGAGKRWKDCKLLEISLKESNADEIGDLMHRRNPGSGSELAQKVAK